MLFAVFPASINWYKFTVMVSAAGFEAGLAPLVDFCSVELGAGNSGGFAAAAFWAVDGAAAGAVGLAPDFKGCGSRGGAPEGPICGGSESSKVMVCTGRVTMTSSPASLASPPASARTSRSVTSRSAWYTKGCATAPTTVMGL